MTCCEGLHACMLSHHTVQVWQVALVHFFFVRTRRAPDSWQLCCMGCCCACSGVSWVRGLSVRCASLEAGVEAACTHWVAPLFALCPVHVCP